MAAIFRRPTPAGLSWADIESLLLACGAHVEERAGSRVGVELNGVAAIFHRPHPRKEASRGAVVAVRRFLTQAGMESGAREKGP